MYAIFHREIGDGTRYTVETCHDGDNELYVLTVEEFEENIGSGHKGRYVQIARRVISEKHMSAIEDLFRISRRFVRDYGEDED